MKRTLLLVAVALSVTLAGCSALSGGGATETAAGGEQVELENQSNGATGVNQTLRMTVGEEAAGSELSEVGATYPREHFTVDSAAHESVVIGVDTDGDGEIEQSFNESHISGVNNNEYSFDITLETDYTLEAGDVVVVQYPAVDNPDESGEYEVDLRLNGEQETTGNVTIE